jgi:nucleoside-diphosphate-sugar epimerase
VDEETAPAPQSERARRRVEAETAWRDFEAQCAVDIFRLAGIYGPGRSMFDDLRDGTARRVVKPGHLFGRIHRDDIALGVVAAMKSAGISGARIFNFSDDEPAASADVVVEAARLLGVEPPVAVPYEEAAAKMSAMGLSFWAENRKVANAKTKAMLGIAWKYPSYRGGLVGILAEERGEGLG